MTAADENERPVGPVGAPIGGTAYFTVKVVGHILSMIGPRGTNIEVQMTSLGQYDEIHDWVKKKMLSIGENAVGPARLGKPCTRHLVALPEPARLRELMRALAVLDMIAMEEWEDRDYSFDPAWGSEQMGSWRDGSGDWFFVWFAGPDSAVIKGFGHESAMTPFKRPGAEPWPGLFDGLPEALSYARDMLEYPAEEVTYCIWHPEGSRWSIGPIAFPEQEEDPDASALHLELLDDEPASYVRARSDRDPAPELSAVGAVYRGEPLTREIVAGIDPKADLARVVKEAREMGYPVSAELLDRVNKPPRSGPMGKKPAKSKKGKAAKRKGHGDGRSG